MTILEEILEHKRIEVEVAKKKHPLQELLRRPDYRRECFSLSGALRKSGIGIIAEIKKASPSKGLIRENFQPAVLAQAYAENGAAALSVLTDQKFFRGCLEFLCEVRSAVGLPILRKDFIVDEYQIHEAKANGADAILLIAAALEKQRIRDLHQTASALGLEVLVEVHQERELDVLDFDAVRLIGINNRDLKTFDVDLSVSLRLKEFLPEGVTVVSESGIESPEQIRKLLERNIHCFLIGETFMRANDPGAALCTFLNEVRA
jgi:indole-3-glycerol phosphate synthase